MCRYSWVNAMAVYGCCRKGFMVEYRKRKGESYGNHIDEDTVNINHTFVDSSLRGMGMAGKLMEAAARQIQKEGKKAVLSCSYAIKWFDSHEEYKDILK